MTRTQIDTYLRPLDLDEAWALLHDGDPHVRALGGGTDLAIACPTEVTTLVDLSDSVSSAITIDDEWIEIGAMATLTAMAEDPSLARHASGVVPEMLVDVGSPLLRNACTIGGHLARGRLSDVIPVLLALDAEVSLHRGESVRMTLDEYYGLGHHERPHVLTAVHLPRPLGRTEAAFARFARTAFDFPILNCCCRVTVGDPGRIRIVVGATPHRSQRAYEAEAIVDGPHLEPDAIEAAAAAAAAEVTTASNWVASAEYRTQLVRALVGRCLARIGARLER